MSESYTALLGHDGARRALVALVLAWTSYGMVGLTVLLVVRDATSSYRVAGAAVAAFSVGSGALAPLRGRLVDARARPWLPLLAAGYALCIAALGTLAAADAPPAVLVALAGGAGASAPPLVAATRGAWSGIVPQPLLRRAYALTSLVGDVAIVAAPAAAGLLFVWQPLVPPLLCGAAALGAAIVLAPAVPPRGRGTPGRLPGRLWTLLAVSVGLGVSLGVVEVAVPASATSWGATGLAGFLLGAFALGSVAGGLWFGSRTWTGSPDRRYLVAVLALGVALPPLGAAGSAGALAALLVVAGLAYGPATVSLFESLDLLAPGRGTEALTWITTAEAAGTAAGAASAGLLGHGWIAFALAGAAVAVPAALALARRRPEPPPLPS